MVMPYNGNTIQCSGNAAPCLQLNAAPWAVQLHYACSNDVAPVLAMQTHRNAVAVALLYHAVPWHCHCDDVAMRLQRSCNAFTAAAECNGNGTAMHLPWEFPALAMPMRELTIQPKECTAADGNGNAIAMHCGGNEIEMQHTCNGTLCQSACDAMGCYCDRNASATQ